MGVEMALCQRSKANFAGSIKSMLVTNVDLDY